jgi:hypothetical protein
MLSTVFVSAADEFTGDLTINAKSLNVRQVHALLHDNAEGLLSSPKQLRILIADRELSIDSLYGTSFPPVVEMGGRGEVQGVLLRIDPSDYRYVDLTILLVKGLQTVTERVSIKNFSITGKRLNASFEYADNSFASDPDYPKVKFSFQISTVIHDLPAVTADLKGPAALKSPQLAALRAIVDTLVVGDFAALRPPSWAARCPPRPLRPRIPASAGISPGRAGRRIPRQSPARPAGWRAAKPSRRSTPCSC